MSKAHPLHWPAGWPRTDERRRRRANFITTFLQARAGLLNELRLLGARDVVISTDVPIRVDGEPYAVRGADRPDDPGVAVWFTLDGEQRVIPCDKWDRVWDNLRAVEKTVEAMRGIERWGAAEMMHAAFAGFAALPAGGEGSGVAWWEVLGVPKTITRYGLDTIWRSVLREHHPDAGGDPEVFLRMKAAYEQGKAALS